MSDRKDYMREYMRNRRQRAKAETANAHVNKANGEFTGEHLRAIVREEIGRAIGPMMDLLTKLMVSGVNSSTGSTGGQHGHPPEPLAETGEIEGHTSKATYSPPSESEAHKTLLDGRMKQAEKDAERRKNIPPPPSDPGIRIPPPGGWPKPLTEEQERGLWFLADLKRAAEETDLSTGVDVNAVSNAVSTDTPSFVTVRPTKLPSDPIPVIVRLTEPKLEAKPLRALEGITRPEEGAGFTSVNANIVSNADAHQEPAEPPLTQANVNYVNNDATENARKVRCKACTKFRPKAERCDAGHTGLINFRYGSRPTTKGQLRPSSDRQCADFVPK